MNSIYFAKNALLIRRSLVRAQVEEPEYLMKSKTCEKSQAFFLGIFQAEKLLFLARAIF